MPRWFQPGEQLPQHSRADIQAIFDDWSARDAKERGREIRCYRDPDGHLVEVEQATG
jgi:hypothetical protein